MARLCLLLRWAIPFWSVAHMTPLSDSGRWIPCDASGEQPLISTTFSSIQFKFTFVFPAWLGQLDDAVLGPMELQLDPGPAHLAWEGLLY